MHCFYSAILNFEVLSVFIAAISDLQKEKSTLYCKILVSCFCSGDKQINVRLEIKW